MVGQLKSGRPVVVATIIRRSGSAPRAVGARMLLYPGGEIKGSVGGGLLEAQILGQGERLFERGQAEVMNFSLMGQGAEAAGMICGGEVDVYLERLDPQDEALINLLERAEGLAKHDRPGVLAVALDEDRAWGRRFLVTPDKLLSLPGAARPEELTSLQESLRQGRVIRPHLRERFYVEPLKAPATVVIFGGGHVSAQIAPLAALVDFRVVVVDDRPEFASQERFPTAAEVICQNFEGVFDALAVTSSSYLVIVTRGHRWDGVILAQALKSEAAYVGMIGSRRKRDAIYAALLQKGFGEEDLKRVHSPVGLDIGAETPEEIGVSIVAELIKVRSQRLASGPKIWRV